MPKHNHKSRIIRRRPGSIMIMVVALLVLMALIGTAYIATARYDRGSASQNADNVQIDLFLESVLNMCKTSIAGDLFDGNGDYRSLTTKTTPAPVGPKDTWFYNHTTSTHYDLATPPLRLDGWLSDRTPDFGSTLANSTNHYFWGRINLPLSTETEATGPARSYFEDPTYVPQNASQPLLLRHRFDTELEPTSKLVNGTPMPAFFINTGITGLPVPYAALAADADGDGIADSFLVRMPIGVINGVTYYYAVRIIDNAAAVNLNTAWGDDVPMTNNDGWGRRLFPTSINLDEKFGVANPPPLFTRNEVKSFHAYRTQRAYTSGTSPLISWTNAQLNAPMPDDAQQLSDARNDFAFSDEHDAFWTGLARRPENPGFLPGSLLHYRAFPMSDLISLVPRFVLAPASSGGTAETRLQADILGPNSLGGPLMLGGVPRTKPYAPDDVNINAFSWGPQNFDYNNTYSRRPLVVTSNSVSNAISP
ncbi:MAG TPA: hypothetical protein VGQ99_07440, partial [Tepidisphaeraceae bacterium]|nr:hypothetical protein [Tepidisphaeraceae bacterium]